MLLPSSTGKISRTCTIALEGGVQRYVARQLLVLDRLFDLKLEPGDIIALTDQGVY